MIMRELSRREALGRAGLFFGATVVGSNLVETATWASEGNSQSTNRPFLFCLNTATLRGHKLGIVKEVEIAAKAGYDAIEPWVDSIQEYVKGGGSVSDLRKRIADLGLSVEGAIGFPEWIVDDDNRRAKGMDQAKRDMEIVASIGGKRFACPPAGATDLPKLDLFKAAERYLELLNASESIGPVPELELWGFSKNLNHLSECVAVALETGHPKACVLADVFHLYKGNSKTQNLSLLGPTAIQVLHMNDYPSQPAREKIDDSYRIYPGDGTAPLPELLKRLHQTGGQKTLSLELFNRKYWQEPPQDVAAMGLAKMKTVAQAALA
jgi:sugar phosphate isomerase/epimerase